MIPYVREIDIDYGRCDVVSPLIRRVTANNPGPFTFRGTGTYIVGHGEVAVIDPGPVLPEPHAAILAAIPGERVSHIVVTHHHLDHSPLARPLADITGAPVYGRAVARPIQDDEVPLEAGYDHFTPDVEVSDGAVVSGPGWSLEAIPTPGHTSNHICYALAEENALFSGDHIMGWSTTVITPPDGDMTDYLASLERVRARNFQTLWPTHGPPITEVAPFIDAYIAHRHDRERQILDMLSGGEKTIAEMVPAAYAAVDQRLWPAAARSMHAAVIALVKAGRVTCDGEPQLGSRYRLVRGGGDHESEV
jgi:glyoxylase-like metal-dependent hydrolase (beta-lactamase superfamily II)